MMKAMIKRWNARIFIVCLWFVFIILFLYAGSIVQFFSKGKSINILVWGAVLDKEFLKDFEEKSGIHINMSYFENNEELFVKLQSTTEHDYDLIMPSDWAVDALIQEGLIKKIDRNKITAWPNIYPTLLNHYFDPDNQYSVPFYWSLYGIGIDKAYFKNKVPKTWGLVFDKSLMPSYVSMPDDGRYIALIAALYLFGEIRAYSAEEIEQIKQLLIQQKPYVEIYTDLRPEYVVASGDVPVVVGLLGDLLKVMRHFDTIDFIIPQEGVFINIDSFVLPVTTRKDELIYQFLNYLCSPEIVEKYVEKFQFLPATQISIEYDERFAYLMRPTKELMKGITFFKNVLPKEVINDIIVSLKS